MFWAAALLLNITVTNDDVKKMVVQQGGVDILMDLIDCAKRPEVGAGEGLFANAGWMSAQEIAKCSVWYGVCLFTCRFNAVRSRPWLRKRWSC